MTASPPPPGRRSLDLVFGLFLLDGLMICATIVAALVALVKPRGEGDPWLMVFAMGMATVVPTLFAWLAGVIRALSRPSDAGVRLAAGLATGQLVLWVGLMALGRFSDISHPSGWLIAAPMLATGLYGVVATALALRWFTTRRRGYGHPAVVGAPGVAQ